MHIFNPILQLHRKEHWKLLSSLKTTVEGLVSTNNPNVWSRYGGLQRLHKDMNNILSNGLKNEQVIISQFSSHIPSYIMHQRPTFVHNLARFHVLEQMTQYLGLSFFVLFSTGAGVLQASGLLAFCVVHSLHQSPSGLTCWTGTFIWNHALRGIWLFSNLKYVQNAHLQSQAIKKKSC